MSPRDHGKLMLAQPNVVVLAGKLACSLNSDVKCAQTYAGVSYLYFNAHISLRVYTYSKSLFEIFVSVSVIFRSGERVAWIYQCTLILKYSLPVTLMAISSRLARCRHLRREKGRVISGLKMQKELNFFTMSDYISVSHTLTIVGLNAKPESRMNN